MGELLAEWKEFAEQQIKATTAEVQRGEMPKMVEEDEYSIKSTVPAPTDEKLELCLKALGRCKAVGKDEIPIEVFAASKVQ